MRYVVVVVLFFVVGCSSKLEPLISTVNNREFKINDKVNPCDNFYDYACSKVIENFKLREDRSRHSFSFTDASDRILEYKKTYFKKLATTKPSTDKEEQIRSVYLSCMDEDARKKEEKALVASTKKKMESLASREDYINLLSNQILTPEFSFIKYDTIPNQDKPLQYDIYKDVFTMKMPDVSYYKNEELMKDYRKTIVKFFESIDSENSEAQAQIIYDYEMGFSRNFPETKEIREIISKRTAITKNKMISNYPHLKMKDSLAAIPANIKFRSFWPKALKYMNDVLGSKELNELKTIYTYYSLQSYLDEAYPDYFKSFFDFSHKHLGGAVKRSEKSERCTKYVMNHFGKEIDYILLPKMFPNFPKEKFIALAEKVRSTLASQIRQNKWLQKSTQKEALRKIETAILQLVTPDTDEEWNFVGDGKYYNDKFIKNKKVRNLKEQEKMFSDLKTGVSRLIWEMSPLTVNAYYHPSYNKFVLPLAILQYPFFDPTLPEEINLGAIGAVVGHELGHAVDDKGSKYNADGLLKNWFTKQDFKNFSKRTEGLIGQWNEVGEDGKFKLGENIGDLVGVTSGYEAAFPEGSNKSQELKQKFFLQYARAWCEVQRPKTAEKRLKTDPHSASVHRVNEQMRQQQAFADAYQCKPGDKMTMPENKRVKVW